MKKILLLGLGKSGLAAAEWLLSQGKEVLGFDDQIKEGEKIDYLIRLGLHIITMRSEIEWNSIAAIVISPGVSADHPLCQDARQCAIEIVGEAEFALRSLSQKAVAITGTNGKTTVTLLTEHILKSAGIKAKSLGNIGEPLSLYAMQFDPEEILVIELSSFQIETLSSKVFDAAVLLNITPDHLDRYASLEEYAHAKCALKNCVRENGSFFVQYRAWKDYRHLLSGPCVTFGPQEHAEWRMDGDRVYVHDKCVWIFPESYENMGQHDKENALAAYLLCCTYGVTPEQFLNALQTFQKPAHRIEFVCEIDGICYYDDSKGTNIDAVIQAVCAMKRPVVLIAGGVDKGASYLPWALDLKDRIKRIVVFGQAAAKIKEELGGSFEIAHVDSLDAAVKAARSAAVKGDAVLLSPGCSSYDMFDNYAHRGEEFKRLVLT